MTICYKEGFTHKKMKAQALDHPDAMFGEDLLAAELPEKRMDFEEAFPGVEIEDA